MEPDRGEMGWLLVLVILVALAIPAVPMILAAIHIH